MTAIISSVVYLPVKSVNVATVISDLTIKHWVMGEKEPRIVEAYWRTPDGYIAVPRSYGLKLIAKYHLRYESELSVGQAMRFPKAVKHEGEYAYQAAFVSEIYAACGRFNDFIVEAATGKGKTVCALSVIQRLGRTALIVVDQENLLLQWTEQAGSKLGLKASQIGRVQGKVCDYEGKHVTIAMMQSLVQREYPREFYDYFGTVVFDEVHTAGAPTFSQSLMMFSAEARFGVSATVERRDDLQKLLNLNLGKVEVSLTDTHDKSYVYYLESGTVYSWYGNVSSKVGRILSEVSDDPVRNAMLVEAVQWLYESGRDILVISDRIEQLENLKAMCYFSGMPDEDMGLYCGFRNEWAFVKDPTPKRRPEGFLKGSEYSPVKYTTVRKRIPKKQLAVVKTTARVIFATFGMFTKGVDEPRLNGGVDCTPRSRAQQVHGRILRKVAGKFIPIWVTIRDINSFRLDHQFTQRIDEYVDSSAEIYEWKPNKGVRLRDVRELKKQAHRNVKELKAANIITCVDGSYTIVMPPTQTKLESPPERPTGRITR